MSTILIIDDDRALCRSLELHLEREGHEVETAFCAAEGLDMVKETRPEIVFCDLSLPDGDGLSLLTAIRTHIPRSVVIMITGVQDTKATIEAVRRGAFDYIRKPLDLDTVLLALEKARRHLERPVEKAVALSAEVVDRAREIIGAHPQIVSVLKEIAHLSRNRVPVLIEGESGTGKELVARTLHEATSPGEPFVAVNCSAVVPTLLESELFGHEKGAFTGAESRKIGKLERAGKGTIFFDEIGDMALDLQAKLLRALQEREFERVGGSETLKLEARVVAATNRDLDSLVKEGAFREDLAYRLAVSRIRIPPLRERKSDIPLLVRHILPRISREVHKPVEAVSESALRVLSTYRWPGNVRELENVLTRAVLLSHETVLSREAVEAAMGSPPPEGGREEREPPKKVRSLREAEKECVEAALASTGWNITRAAKILQISPTTLRKKIHDHGLERG